MTVLLEVQSQECFNDDGKYRWDNHLYVAVCGRTGGYNDVGTHCYCLVVVFEELLIRIIFSFCLFHCMNLIL